MFTSNKYQKIFKIMEKNVQSHKADILYDFEFIEKHDSSLCGFKKRKKREDYFLWGLRPTGTTILSVRDLVFSSSKLSFEEIKNKLTMSHANKIYYILDFNDSETKIYPVSVENINNIINDILAMRAEYDERIKELLNQNQSEKNARKTLNNNYYFAQLVSEHFEGYLH